MKLFRYAPLLFVLSAAGAGNGQMTWHVDDDCVAPGSGTQGDPFCSIQQGVDAASDGDTVLVAPGTYKGNGNRDISLFGKRITLRSTDGPAVTVLDIQGTPTCIHRGFFLVHGESRETLIEGFTITKGYLIGDTGGSGPAGGGGGAGIYLGHSSPTIRNCVVRENISKTLGNPFVHDGRGAGIYLDRESSAVIDGCTIIGNEAERQGGGVLHIGGEGTVASVRNCLVASNSARQGGGIHNAGGMASFVSSTIVDNVAVIAGGGFKNEQSQGFIRSCTIWGNQSDNGAQIYVQGPALYVEYSAVEGGAPGISGPGAFDWGPGNIDADPLFFDPDNGDFRLLHGSSCIDAGNNLAVPEGLLTDLDGGPRFLDDPNIADTGNPDGIHPLVDMGAYEFDHQDCNNNDTPDSDDLTNGTSQDCNGNGNGIPDECEVDCNNNGQADSCDIAAEISDDCTANGIPDECEPDCNANGQADSCDIASKISDDCNADGVPDECEADCNSNGQADGCDIADDVSGDCNDNAVPDECDIESGASLDENGNGIPDECQCLGELDADGQVRVSDLVILLSAWGPCPDPDDCPADFNSDGEVRVPDLVTLLEAWGPCP